MIPRSGCPAAPRGSLFPPTLSRLSQHTTAYPYQYLYTWEFPDTRRPSARHRVSVLTCRRISQPCRSCRFLLIALRLSGNRAFRFFPQSAWLYISSRWSRRPGILCPLLKAPTSLPGSSRSRPRPRRFLPSCCHSLKHNTPPNMRIQVESIPRLKQGFLFSYFYPPYNLQFWISSFVLLFIFESFHILTTRIITILNRFIFLSNMFITENLCLVKGFVFFCYVMRKPLNSGYVSFNKTYPFSLKALFALRNRFMVSIR